MLVQEKMEESKERKKKEGYNYKMLREFKGLEIS
jgi:hypothetical protein